MRAIIAAAIISSLAAGTPAQAAKAGGINIAESTTINGQKLVLNGAGVRSKLFIKVYVGSLYLTAKQNNPSTILAADAPRQMNMNFLFDVDKGKIAEAWTEGLAANVPAASAEVKKNFNLLSSWMEDMKKGESLSLTYLPATGTQVAIKGKVKGTLAGKATADAILATWIGSKPGPGEEFKKAVLGR